MMGWVVAILGFGVGAGIVATLCLFRANCVLRSENDRLYRNTVHVMRDLARRERADYGRFLN
jgi:hypothetical protein